MANSITLNQALIDDIKAKIDAGTATAEEVVLYTKGLNQLQSGNDFQSVVIGLSQSAVDAIDSANAQFQEDTADALVTFGQTATNINTSATNAVSAINNAKDTLNSTNTSLSSTIAGLPSISVIREKVKADREYVHPYDRPAFYSVEAYAQETHEASIIMYNHYGNRIPWPKYGFMSLDQQMSTQDFASSRRLGNAHSKYGLNTENNSPFLTYRVQTTNSGYELGFANSLNHYGHVMGRFADNDGNFHGYNGSWNSTWMRDTCVIVNDIDQRYMLLREGDTFYIGGAKDPTKFKSDHSTRALLKDRAQLTGAMWKYEKYLWDVTHERFTIVGNGTGYGNACYNKTLNQLVVMKYDGTVGYQKPLLYSFSNDWNLKNIGLGTQEISYNYDTIANSKATLEIESTVNNSSGMPGTPNLSESSYRGVPILCDNGKIVHFMSMGNNISGASYGFRWQKNEAGTDYIKDRTFTFSGNTTKYGYDQGEYYGIRHHTTNDGKYVIARDHYYYYGTGARMLFVRVSDGKCLTYLNNDSTWGFDVTPTQLSKFIIHLHPHHLNTHTWLIDMDELFAIYEDGTAINFYQTAGEYEFASRWSNIQGQSYSSIVNLYKSYAPELEFISQVDKQTDTRTI
jgi:hypothetical protein